MKRKKIDLGVKSRLSGIDFIVTQDGIEIGGFYDSFVGIEGRLIPWAEIDAARREVVPSEWHRHQWENGGEAKSFMDHPCTRWCCVVCGEVREQPTKFPPPRPTYGGKRKRKMAGR